ncbi:dihydrodipicolinate synthase family protein [Pelagibacteraceae bacterium]|nr:dihydrodipicolinate synthase family protein [Pelagibacteraceae bacterium]
MTNLDTVFSASVSLLNADMKLDIGATIEHALKVDKLGVSPAFLGSTSQAQLLEISDKKKLIKEITKHKFKDVIIGTGCNSLGDTKNLIRYSMEQGFKGAFLIMNPSYYSPEDLGVYNFFSDIVKEIPCKILFYNFSKLAAGYAFSENIVKKLVNEYGTEYFVGMKDSTGNLWNNLKIDNFSMLVGNEINLLKNLSLGESRGCISATTQICPSLARKVFEKKDQKDFEKMCTIRRAFDSTGNLVTSVHYFLSLSDSRYKKMLPPLTPLSKEKQRNLLSELKKIGIHPERKAA